MIIPLLLLVLLYLFMIAPRMLHKPERGAFYGVHYAHRGLYDNDSEAPENSLEAFRRAVESGYGIEFDVQLSKDGIPVVFHDASLKRMCGVEGNVWEYTLAELSKMRLANSEQTIPTFEQVLGVIDGKVPIIIEYKMDRVDTQVCELGNQILQKYQGPYCVESFHPLAVYWYRKNRPDVMRGQLSENFAKRSKKRLHLRMMTYLLTNFLTRPDFIAYNHEDADNVSRNLCRWFGGLSVAYTIKNREQYQSAKDQFDLFIFDSFHL